MNLAHFLIEVMIKIEGLIIEFRGIHITVVHITRSMGYVDRNMAAIYSALTGNQHRMLDDVIQIG